MVCVVMFVIERRVHVDERLCALMDGGSMMMVDDDVYVIHDLDVI